MRFFSCIVCTRDNYGAVSWWNGRGSRNEDPYHLLRDHYDGFGRKSSVTMIKEVFKRGSQKVNDENIVKALLAEVVDVRNPGYRTIKS